MKRLFKFFSSLLSRRFYSRISRTTHYSINGREVSEAEWYVNGGFEVERRLEEMEKYLRKL